MKAKKGEMWELTIQIIRRNNKAEKERKKTKKGKKRKICNRKKER